MQSSGSVLDGEISPGKPDSQQWAASHRLLASETFASAPRLREVLEYLLRNLESGTASDITEQSIGQAVFGRPPGYNASEDNIVRVTIRHLRARLSDYYRAEGSGEALELVIPKGKYQPVFLDHQPNSHDAPGEVAGPITTAEVTPSNGQFPEACLQAPPMFADRPDRIRSVDQPEPRSHRLWWAALIGAACILVAFFGGYSLRSRPSVPSIGILGRLCPPGSRISVVLVDSNLQAYRSIFGLQVSLNNYLSRNYGNDPLHSDDPRVSNALHVALDSNDTNVSSALIGSSVERLLTGREVYLQHPRDVSMREFQEPGNIILLGGPWVNPWGQLFEKRLNFRMVPLPNNPAYSEIHNSHPMKNEPTDFIPYKDGNLNVDFVRIAILPGFNAAGRVFLLGATSTESLEAAGEYLLSDEALTRLLAQFHVGQAGNLPSIEVVLEVKGFDSVPGGHRIVASRIVPNG